MPQKLSTVDDDDEKAPRLPAVLPVVLGNSEDKSPCAESDCSPKALPEPPSRRLGFLLQAGCSFTLTSMISLAKLLEAPHGADEEESHILAKGAPKGAPKGPQERLLPVPQVVLVRSFVVVAFALSVLAKEGVSPLGKPPCHPVALLRGAIGAIAVLSMFYLVTLLPLTEVIAISLVQPVWACIFGKVFLHEPLRRAVLLAGPICAAGVLLIARPWAAAGGAFPKRGLGVAVGLLHTSAGAGAKTCVRYLGKGGYHPQVIVMYLTVFGSVASASLMFAQGGAVMPENWQWLVMLLIGSCAFAGQTMATMALRSITATECALVNYLNLVWSEIYSLLIFSEVPHASSVAGAALIVLCTFVLVRFK